jgi:hypothetical protein
MAVSSPQALVTVQVYDYEVGLDGKPLAGARVGITLQANQTTTSVSPLVDLDSRTLTVTTDANGFWSINLVPNLNITPANTVYSVRTPTRSYDIQITGTAGPYQASTLSVTTPTNLPVNTTVVPNPLTIQGLLTAQAGLSVTGPVSFPAASIPLSALTPAPATDSLAMHLAGAETVTGIKTFSANPVFNAAAIPLSALTPAAAQDSLAMHLAGAETITGIKTFNANPVFQAGAIPNTALALTYLQAGAAQTATVATPEAGNFSAAYGNLATLGPVVTVTTGTQALVGVFCLMGNGTANNSSSMGFSVSGASTIPASDAQAVRILAYTGSTGLISASAIFLVTVTPGINTFTARYSTNGVNNATFANRNIFVIPFV